MNYTHADTPKVIGSLFVYCTALSSKLTGPKFLRTSIGQVLMVNALVWTSSTSSGCRLIRMLKRMELGSLSGSMLISGIFSFLQICNFIIGIILLGLVYGTKMLI